MTSDALADMNGPLGYWGPAGRTLHPSATNTPARGDSDRGSLSAALTALARTLHGRTWSGTHALMMSLLAAGDSGSAAARRPKPAALDR